MPDGWFNRYKKDQRGIERTSAGFFTEICASHIQEYSQLQMKEETNLDVTVERILYEKSDMDTKKNQVFTTLIYLCSLSGTDETIELDLEEHDAYKWVTKEEILEMNDNDLVSYMKELMRVSLKT